MNRDFLSNLTSIVAVGIYAMSITDILTTIVLATASILNIINIIEKTNKKKREKLNNNI